MKPIKKIAFFFLLWFLSIGCSYYEERELARKYYPEGKYISVGKFDIFVLEKNIEHRKGKSPIIFIHGFSSGVHTWEYYLKELGKDYPVIAFDLPGFGFSSKPSISYTRKLYVEVLEDLIHFYRFKRVILVGNSMGGEIALRYSILYPEKVEKLILIDSAGLIERKDLPWFLQLGRTFFIDYLSFLFTNRLAVSYMLKTAFYNKEVVDERKIDLYYYPLKTKGGINAHKSLLKSPLEKISVGRLQSLSIPVLILWGEEDTWIPVRYAYEFKKYLPNSKLMILPKCGHLPQEEKPVESLEYIREFLKESSLQDL